MPYLLIINYSTDTEGNIVDYTIERRRERLKTREQRGFTAIQQGGKEDFETFFEDFLWRVELKDNIEDGIEAYVVENMEPEVEKKVRILTFNISSREYAERVIQSLTAKINATYEFTSSVGKTYTAYIKKRQTRIEFPQLRTADLFISIEGYGDVVDFLTQKIENEIGHLGVVE